MRSRSIVPPWALAGTTIRIWRFGTAAHAWAFRLGRSLTVATPVQIGFDTPNVTKVCFAVQ
jgi:hypothetical protein